MFRMGIVIIEQLADSPDTIWLKMLGLLEKKSEKVLTCSSIKSDGLTLFNIAISFVIIIAFET